MYLNLLKETTDIMRDNNKTPADVFYCRTEGENFSWKVFAEAAKHFNYDNGFGVQEVRKDLVIIGKDWWLKRREYDGAEWWEFLTRPEAGDTKVVNTINLKSDWNWDWQD